jgi:hypothetical protein
MEGARLEPQTGVGGTYAWKVDNPNQSWNIPQMKSQQIPFRAGGNQVPYFLGIKGNCCITQKPPNEVYGIYQRTLNQALMSARDGL